MDLFQCFRQTDLIREKWCGSSGRIFGGRNEFETGSIGFGLEVYFVRDGDEETGVDGSFGGDAYCGGDVCFYGEGFGGGGGEGEVDAGVGERSSFAGVIKVLYKCRERVEFRGSSVPTH